MKTVSLQRALNCWEAMARLEEGLATAQNPEWIAQVKALLVKSEWERIRPVLQKIADENQEFLQRHVGYLNAPAA